MRMRNKVLLIVLTGLVVLAVNFAVYLVAIEIAARMMRGVV